jgi:hypothetical protein
MIIYPDTNIIVCIEKGELSLAQIKEHFGTYELILPYSDGHLYETDTMSAYGDFTKEQLLAVRFSVLDHISHGLWLTTRAKQIMKMNKASEDAYKSICDYPDGERIKQGFEENMPEAARKIFRKVTGLEQNIINHMALGDIVDHLNKQLTQAGMGKFTDFIAQWEEQMNQPGEISRYDRIAMYFGLFDLMGFYKDKATDKSDFARMWDSNHADYAVETDGFLSRDKRARKKAELTYFLMGIQTPVYEI